MALFQRRPQIGTVAQLYTLGQNKTVVVAGLGNLGREYETTRHNVGFICLDAFVGQHDEMSGWIERKDLKCHFSKGNLGDTHVIAIKPTTLMNLSGEAVQAVCHFYKVASANALVVHDELDIAFGQIRLRVGGSPAGHNGIKSVSSAIGDEYGRIRIGIGPKHPATIDSADFVLQKFSADEQTQLPHLEKEVNAIITEYIYGGLLPHETRTFII